MSGIAGIICFDGSDAELRLLRKMTSSMGYRGPDGIAHWAQGPAALGHCMLHTTPESLEEIQPLHSEDAQRTLVMDGRIDNWEELRHRLLQHGCRLRTRSDAELVLKAFETWGKACLTHIDGDFALAIWDAGRRELFMARDRFGAKPLFYHFDGKRLAFASEISAVLLLPWVQEVLNEGILAETLAGDLVTACETVWRDIYRLDPATQFVCSNGKLRSERFWKPEEIQRLRYRKQSEYAEHYRHLLFETVRRHARSNRPIGCDVSGGLDSSSIFAVSVDLEEKGKLPAPGIQGYTLLFDDDSRANELLFAREVAKHTHRPVREVKPAIEDLEWHRDFANRFRVLPPAPNGVMQSGIFKEAAVGCSAFFTGVGGDEWLEEGINTYARIIREGDISEAFGILKEDIKARGFRSTLYEFARHGVLPLSPNYLKRIARRALIRVRGGKQNGSSPLSPKILQILNAQKSKRPATTRKMMKFHLKNPQSEYLSNQFSLTARETMERLASIEGLELRRPLYSTPIVEFSLSIPPGHMRWCGVERSIHRDALKDILPEMVRTRPGKAYFESVFVKNMTQLGEAHWWTEALVQRGWIDQKATDALLGRYRVPRENALVELALWNLFACGTLAWVNDLR